MQQTPVRFLGREDLLEKDTANPLQYLCLENPRGQRSLAGYSPRRYKELDRTESLSLSLHFHRCPGSAPDPVSQRP